MLDQDNSSSNPTKVWNKGRLTGQKRPLKPKDVWAIRVRLQLKEHKRELALFNLAIDSKLRGCDLVQLQVNDVCTGGRVRDRATVVQRKTGRPVQFEITPADPLIDSGVAPQRRGAARAILVPEPPPGGAAPFDPTICADCP